MKIKLLKNHVLGKQGDIVETNYHRAKYLIAMGVAVEQKRAKVEAKAKEEIIDKENSNGSNTKKRATRKSKTNVKP